MSEGRWLCLLFRFAFNAIGKWLQVMPTQRKSRQPRLRRRKRDIEQQPTETQGYNHPGFVRTPSQTSNEMQPDPKFHYRARCRQKRLSQDSDVGVAVEDTVDAGPESQIDEEAKGVKETPGSSDEPIEEIKPREYVPRRFSLQPECSSPPRCNHPEARSRTLTEDLLEDPGGLHEQASRSESPSPFFICVNSPVDTVIGPLDAQDRAEVEILLNQHSDMERGTFSSSPDSASSLALTDFGVEPDAMPSDTATQPRLPTPPPVPFQPPIWHCDLRKLLTDFRRHGIKYAVQHVSKETGRSYWDVPQIVPPPPGLVESTGQINAQVMWISRVQVTEFASLEMTYSRGDSYSAEDDSLDVDILRFKDYSKWRDECVVDAWYEVNGQAYRQGPPPGAAPSDPTAPPPQLDEHSARIDEEINVEDESLKGDSSDDSGFSSAGSRPSDLTTVGQDSVEEIPKNTPDEPTSVNDDIEVQCASQPPLEPFSNFPKSLYKSRFCQYASNLSQRQYPRKTRKPRRFFHHLRGCFSVTRLALNTVNSTGQLLEAPETQSIPRQSSPILQFPGSWSEIAIYSPPRKVYTKTPVISPGPSFPGAWRGTPRSNSF
ncbi:hypothetical protein NP233_g2741 [Leucocoprinus birnbaumii]|uniref:Uncharacterized protein n=1 Tax=Leucocoprinus birnbaumii TaxID=56174 RepID=A0AAD5VYC3_9AGAR|nr:hypothetical protein NP233_g2741 [Leucocoprinus birnbaumii]